jgi:hypothetical protein
MRAFTLAGVVAFFAASVFGCGKHAGRATVYPVSGKVFVRGTAAEGVRVVFYPTTDELRKPGMPLPAGETDATGTYHLQSYAAADGAPLGDYQVTISWPEPVPPNANREQYQQKDRLGGKYLDPAKSQLAAKVEKGGGEIHPFELQ